MRTLVFLVGLCAIALGHRPERLERVEPFRADTEYTFRYDAQVAAGLSSEASAQKAATRIQAQIKLSFRADDEAVLRMQEIRFGQTNQEITEPQNIKAMRFFEEKPISEEQKQQLRMPAQIQLQNGLVKRITFQEEDAAWSKNVKRGVINLIQLNLNHENADYEKSEETHCEKDQIDCSFTHQEITLEGKCKVAYTLNAAEQKPTASAEETRRFNVTKAVDFAQCSEVADVAYGFHSQEIQSWCTQALKTDAQERDGLPRQLCDAMEVKQRKVDRSTVFRYTLAGKPTHYGIERAEVLSQYLVKHSRAQAQQTASQVVVVAQLVLEQSEQPSQRVERVQGQEESLLYNAQQEAAEKRFFMLGDEEFANGKRSPFEQVPNKAGIAKQIVHRMLEGWQQHIDADAALQLGRLVEVLRMSTVNELQKIWKTLARGNTGLALKSDEQERLEQVLQDALAIAGTRNTIHVLVEKIINGEIPTEKAVQTMKSLAGIPAPSAKQSKEIERLCKSEVSQQSGPLKQACWLAYGALIGDLCRERPVKAKMAHEHFETEKLCPRDTKQHFKNIIMEQYKNAENTYEKTLALKALGNAGLDIAVQELEEIIRSPRQEPLIRIQAIDSLRRLRSQMPHKIHRMLMPLFENNREQPEVRMAAFAMIMHTLPEKSIINQITYALLRERSENVKSFVFTIAKALAKSTIPAEQQMAQQLESALKMAKIEAENLRASRQYRVPVYSEEQQEGAFLSVASMVSTRNALPAHLAARMDLLLNEELECGAAELHFSQTDLERWYEKALQLVGGEARPTRGRRSQRRGSDQLRSMHSERGYKSRRSQIGRESQQETPFGMLCVRFGDVDHVVVPIAEQHLPRAVRNALQGEKPRLSELLNAIPDSTQFRMASAMLYGEKRAALPTSVGLPLRLKQSIPVLSSVHGSLKIDVSAQRPKAQLRLHTVATPVFEHKVEVWCPVAASGVTARQSLELNMPLEIHAQAQKEQLKVSAKLPQQKQTLAALHSLPATYTVEAPEKSEPQREQQLKTIHSRRPQQEVEVKLGQSLGMPLSLKGHYYRPAEFSYRSLVEALSFTESSVRVEYEPTSQSPQQIEFQAEWSLFEKISMPKMELNEFFRENKFDSAYHGDESYESMELDSESERHRKLNRYLGEYKPKSAYKHTLKMIAKTVGGERQRELQVDLEGMCEAQLTTCKVDLKARTHADWEMSAQLQTLFPETVKSVAQLEQLSEKQKHFIAKIVAHWGRQQQLTVSVQGEPAMTRYQRTLEQQIAEKRPQFKVQSRFVNKYDVEASYKLSPETQNIFNKAYEALKATYFWQSSSELKEGSEGHVHVSAIIDPISRRHANLTIRTPTERVRFQSVQLPTHTRPLPFVRRPVAPKHSVSGMLTALTSPMRAECRVSDAQVRTFDDIIYGAALPKCYTAVAKDCTSEEPRFAVLMKQENDQDKKLKVITEEAVIEAKPKGDSFYLKVNDERVEMDDWQKLTDAGIHYDEARQELTIQAEGVTVHFDGQQASVSVSPLYKNGVCGLCGHYDGEGDDELRMKNNELTTDLKEFHRSYVHPTEDECSNDEFEAFYGKQKFQSQRRYESSSEENDEDYFDAKPTKKWRKSMTEESTEKIDPIEVTETLEYHNKVCFSMRPVKKCPLESDAEDTTEKTVPFQCYARGNLQAQRMLRQVRNGAVLDLADEQQSLTRSIQIPRTCVSVY